MFFDISINKTVNDFKSQPPYNMINLQMSLPFIGKKSLKMVLLIIFYSVFLMKFIGIPLASSAI